MHHALFTLKWYLLLLLITKWCKARLASLSEGFERDWADLLSFKLNQWKVWRKTKCLSLVSNTPSMFTIPFKCLRNLTASDTSSHWNQQFTTVFLLKKEWWKVFFRMKFFIIQQKTEFTVKFCCAKCNVCAMCM